MPNLKSASGTANSNLQQDFLPFARPTISDEAIAEVVACLQSGWITTGPRVEAFENALRAYCEAPHADCVSSATAGLYAVLMALDLKPGDEVITTPMTFVATLNTVVLAGGRPVLVDINPTDYNINVARIEDAITPRTRAIMPVHFAGLPVDLDKVYDLARKYNLRVIEDAAHAIGAMHNDRKLGSFGDIQVFSFHPNKNMTTGEGGCITSRDDIIHQRLTSLRFHGMDRVAWNRFSKSGSQHYDVIEPAHKFNMMDIQAALGLHQIPALDGFIAQRTHLVHLYQNALAEWPELTLPQAPIYSHKHAWHLFAPTINPDIAQMDRDTLMQRLKEEHNIGTGLHYRAVHNYRYYQKQFGFKRGDFLVAENVGDRILSLPLFPLMKETDVDRVVGALAKIFGRTWS